MAVTSARDIVDLKEKGHFERENARTEKYTLADELPAQLSALDLRPRVMSVPAYRLQRLTADDKHRVLEFLNRFFFRDEPLNMAVNLLETPESRCVDLEKYAVKALHHGVSVAAVDENGDIVGLIINAIVRRKDSENVEKPDDSSDPKFQRILKLLSHLNHEARIWDKLPECCDTLVDAMIASTHPAWRGKGLLKALCGETERFAKAVGATAMRMDTTSCFSAAAVERLKYKCAYSVCYKDLPFAPQPEAPHLEARVYIKELL